MNECFYACPKLENSADTDIISPLPPQPSGSTCLLKLDVFIREETSVMREIIKRNALGYDSNIT